MIKNGSFLICGICKREYYVRGGRIKTSKFCSRKCHRKHQKTLRGIFTNNYKGGHIREDGYIVVWSNGKFYYKHRLIMEKSLGRKLKKSEIVHHLDGDTTNNSLENLVITNRADHLILHDPLSKRWHK